MSHYKTERKGGNISYHHAFSQLLPEKHNVLFAFFLHVYVSMYFFHSYRWLVATALDNTELEAEISNPKAK